MKPGLIVIAGTASNTGKTTLLCDLLRELSPDQPWEAIKLTRGHYRSCGKDPHACCVSHLLGEQPVVRSGREETYGLGKDTGRYWDVGASNVHWVITTDSQVEQGIRMALSQVKSDGVLIEGTSLLKFIKPDFAVLAAGADAAKVKPSARRALADGKIDAVFVSDKESIVMLPQDLIAHLPIYDHADLPLLLEHLKGCLSRADVPRSLSSIPQTQSVL